MKFSQSWLRTFVASDLTGTALADALTMAGLEVEEMETAAPSFSGVVVGHILSVENHPDADRLHVCAVDVGEAEPLQIVCGAPNAAAGLKVPCARVGARLPGDMKIKKAKMRGVESFGMLCSARELGINQDHGGLLTLPADAVAGTDVRQVLDLDDVLLTLKLTPNRADGLSLLGVAREVSALTGAALHLPEILPVAAQIADRRAVHLQAPDACPRYLGRVFTGLNAKAPTPDWMRQRLERSGVRSISVLVDITNYVMLELGQPLHAFDQQKIVGDIVVRRAQSGESLRLLNEQTLNLAEDVLVIADEEKALAAAGIMGGADSGITLETCDLFLESAFFTPFAIAGRARRYGFSSDASHRYERGVDFDGCRRAMDRASRLILELAGGQAGEIVEVSSPEHLPQRNPVSLRRSRAEKVLGISLSHQRVHDLLNGLKMPFSEQGDTFSVTPPSWRFDIEIEADLIEEVARLVGYDNIPAHPPCAALTMLPQSEKTKKTEVYKKILADRGYQEVINFAFVDEQWERDFADNPTPIRLANPIASHLSVLRSTLIGGLIANVHTNLKRKQNRLRLFECGRVFSRSTAANASVVAGFSQPWHLAGLLYGHALPEGWGNDVRKVDFFDAKGDLQALLCGRDVQFKPAEHPALHPGRTASVWVDGQEIGVIGEIHPQWLQSYDLPQAPMVFELRLDSLEHSHIPQYKEVCNFPPVWRDLAVVVDRSLNFATLLEHLRPALPELVKDLLLFDIYVGAGVPENRKSLAFRIVLQDTQRTLQDSEVDAVIEVVVKLLQDTCGAQLRS